MLMCQSWGLHTNVSFCLSPLPRDSQTVFIPLPFALSCPLLHSCWLSVSPETTRSWQIVVLLSCVLLPRSSFSGGDDTRAGSDEWLQSFPLCSPAAFFSPQLQYFSEPGAHMALQCWGLTAKPGFQTGLRKRRHGVTSVWSFTRGVIYPDDVVQGILCCST